MKPPGLRTSPESVEWHALVDDLYGLYQRYLPTRLYHVAEYKSMTDGLEYFGRQFSASFGGPDIAGELVTIAFTLNTDGSDAGNDAIRERKHKKDDQTLLSLRSMPGPKGWGNSTKEALRHFPVPAGGSSDIQPFRRGTSAWWRACSPGPVNTSVVFYGVLDHSTISRRRVLAAKPS